MLAGCYYNGEGVSEDKEEAIKWYRKAAEQGQQQATALLKQIEEEQAETENTGSSLFDRLSSPSMVLPRL